MIFKKLYFAFNKAYQQDTKKYKKKWKRNKLYNIIYQVLINIEGVNKRSGLNYINKTLEN